MPKTTHYQHRVADPSAYPGVINFFPFMRCPNWYREYWYEKERGRIRKLLDRLFRLGARPPLPPSAVTVPGKRSGPDRPIAALFALR